MKKTVKTSLAPQAIGPYSQAVWAGPFLFCSGQVSIQPTDQKVVLGTVQEQAHLVLQNIQGLLKSQDMTLDNVVKTTIFLLEMEDFAAVNEIYAQYFSEPYPARSTVAVKGLPKGVRVEIEVIASK